MSSTAAADPTAADPAANPVAGPAAETLSRHLRRAVPRYTSYPTAPHFHPGVGAETYLRWLAETPTDAPISLYVHIPFCHALCWYCGCNMKLAARYAPVAAYVDGLLAEIALIADAAPARLPVGRVHFGGGTPTALRPDDLERVTAALRARFDIRDDAEIAIEGDPRTLSPEMIARIGALGFTRASFGVQEFDPAVQRAINRVQPAAQVAACVEALRAAGVSAVNFDLIYGLPKQTAAALERTIAACVEMRPSRVALFGYAHVPWMAKKQRLISEADLPGPEARLEQAERAARALEAAGYQPIGIDHFALPDDPLARAARAGRLRRNFQGYTDDAADTLLGFGATAIGRTRFGFVQNMAETGAWARAVAEGRPPIAKGRALTDEDRVRGAAIEALMCDGRVDLGAVGRRCGAPEDWWLAVAGELAALSEDGLARLSGDTLSVTPLGRPAMRVVAAAFDAYLAASAARHSVAV